MQKILKNFTLNILPRKGNIKINEINKYLLFTIISGLKKLNNKFKKSPSKDLLLRK